MNSVETCIRARTLVPARFQVKYNTGEAGEKGRDELAVHQGALLPWEPASLAVTVLEGDAQGRSTDHVLPVSFVTTHTTMAVTHDIVRR